MAFLIYSGFTVNTPPIVSGIHKFFQFKTGTNTYVTDSSHLTIDTPNYPTLVGNGFPTNGNPCGSGLTQAGENTQARGPAFAINSALPSGGSQTWNNGFFHMGGVDWTTYTSTAGKSANTFSADIGEGANQFDGIGSPPNQSIHPGNLIQENINVILPSQYYLGQKTGVVGVASNARRIHYEVVPGGMGLLLSKIYKSAVGAMTIGSVGPGILASYSDEQAASVWLSNGYGLERLGSPYFCTY